MLLFQLLREMTSEERRRVLLVRNRYSNQRLHLLTQLVKVAFACKCMMLLINLPRLFTETPKLFSFVGAVISLGATFYSYTTISEKRTLKQVVSSGNFRSAVAFAYIAEALFENENPDILSLQALIALVFYGDICFELFDRSTIMMFTAAKIVLLLIICPFLSSLVILSRSVVFSWAVEQCRLYLFAMLIKHGLANDAREARVTQLERTLALNSNAILLLEKESGDFNVLYSNSTADLFAGEYKKVLETLGETVPVRLAGSKDEEGTSPVSHYLGLQADNPLVTALKQYVSNRQEDPEILSTVQLLPNTLFTELQIACFDGVEGNLLHVEIRKSKFQFIKLGKILMRGIQESSTLLENWSKAITEVLDKVKQSSNMKMLRAAAALRIFKGSLLDWMTMNKLSGMSLKLVTRQRYSHLVNVDLMEAEHFLKGLGEYAKQINSERKNHLSFSMQNGFVKGCMLDLEALSGLLHALLNFSIDTNSGNKFSLKMSAKKVTETRYVLEFSYEGFTTANFCEAVLNVIFAEDEKEIYEQLYAKYPNHGLAFLMMNYLKKYLKMKVIVFGGKHPSADDKANPMNTGKMSVNPKEADVTSRSMKGNEFSQYPDKQEPLDDFFSSKNFGVRTETDPADCTIRFTLSLSSSELVFGTKIEPHYKKMIFEDKPSKSAHFDETMLSLLNEPILSSLILNERIVKQCDRSFSPAMPLSFMAIVNCREDMRELENLNEGKLNATLNRLDLFKNMQLGQIFESLMEWNFKFGGFFQKSSPILKMKSEDVSDFNDGVSIRHDKFSNNGSKGDNHKSEFTGLVTIVPKRRDNSVLHEATPPNESRIPKAKVVKRQQPSPIPEFSKDPSNPLEMKSCVAAPRQIDRENIQLRRAKLVQISGQTVDEKVKQSLRPETGFKLSLVREEVGGGSDKQSGTETPNPATGRFFGSSLAEHSPTDPLALFSPESEHMRFERSNPALELSYIQGSPSIGTPAPAEIKGILRHLDQRKPETPKNFQIQSDATKPRKNLPVVLSMESFSGLDTSPDKPQSSENPAVIPGQGNTSSHAGQQASTLSVGTVASSLKPNTVKSVLGNLKSINERERGGDRTPNRLGNNTPGHSGNSTPNLTGNAGFVSDYSFGEAARRRMDEETPSGSKRKPDIAAEFNRQTSQNLPEASEGGDLSVFEGSVTNGFDDSRFHGDDIKSKRSNYTRNITEESRSSEERDVVVELTPGARSAHTRGWKPSSQQYKESKDFLRKTAGIETSRSLENSQLGMTGNSSISAILSESKLLEDVFTHKVNPLTLLPSTHAYNLKQAAKSLGNLKSFDDSLIDHSNLDDLRFMHDVSRRLISLVFEDAMSSGLFGLIKSKQKVEVEQEFVRASTVLSKQTKMQESVQLELDLPCQVETRKEVIVQKETRSLRVWLENIEPNQWLPNDELRVLIVDDTYEDREVIRELVLEDYPTCITDFACNGLEAFEKVQVGYRNGMRYDLVFMDMNMAEHDGTAGISMIRGFERRNKIQRMCNICAVSGDEFEETKDDQFNIISKAQKPLSLELVKRLLKVVSSQNKDVLSPVRGDFKQMN